MTEFDNNMEIILSKVVSDNERAPIMRVNLEIDGVKYKAGLWVWERKDGTPITDKDGNKKYKGRLEIDDYQPQAESKPAPHRPNADGLYDTDIPF